MLFLIFSCLGLDICLRYAHLDGYITKDILKQMPGICKNIDLNFVCFKYSLYQAVTLMPLVIDSA